MQAGSRTKSRKIHGLTLCRSLCEGPCDPEATSGLELSKVNFNDFRRDSGVVLKCTRCSVIRLGELRFGAGVGLVLIANTSFVRSDFCRTYIHGTYLDSVGAT